MEYTTKSNYAVTGSVYKPKYSISLAREHYCWISVRVNLASCCKSLYPKRAQSNAGSNYYAAWRDQSTLFLAIH